MLKFKNIFFSSKKPELSLKAKQELIEIYYDSIKELEDMTQRDLSTWYK